MKSQQPVAALVLTCLITFTQELEAGKTNEAIYQAPFDLAAGGASLTRASQEGIVFSNPALLTLGGAKVRWFGTQVGAIADQNLAKAISGSGLETDNMADLLLDRSYHVGQSLSLSFLNQNFAVAVFDRIELDYEGQRYSDGGLPAIEIGVEAYGGALFSVASRPRPWLSLGASLKYLIAAEPQLSIPLADQDELAQVLSNPARLQEELEYGEGIGLDVGSLLFFQGRRVDYSFALKVDDVADTALSSRSPFYQTINAGVGLAFHGRTEVLHLSLDYRDILDVYEERPFKKIYLGARLLIRQRLGLATGLYQGIPTAGVTLDLHFLKLGLTAYGRELGQYPGEKQRNLYYGYLAFGF